MPKKHKGPTAPRRCPKPDCRERRPCPIHGEGWAPAQRRAKENPEYALPRDWEKRRNLTKLRFKSRCAKCGALAEDGQADHIVPRFLGGDHSMPNLQWLCSPCHDEKTREERKLAQRLKKRR